MKSPAYRKAAGNVSSGKSSVSSVKRPAGRPQDEARGDAILSVTLNILAEKGYAGLTVDEIVARARVSKSTIYRRWPTKEELVIAAFDRLPPIRLVNRGNLLDDLLEIVRQYDRLMHQTPLASVLPALVSESFRNTALATQLRATIERRKLPSKTVLARAIDRGELPPDTDIELAHELMMAPLVQRSFFEADHLDLDEFRKMFSVIIAGLNSSRTEQADRPARAGRQARSRTG